MKFCPKCETQYTDESLQFCYEDGSVLLDFYSSGNWQPPEKAHSEIETVVRLDKKPVTLKLDKNHSSWEQSQVTQVSTLLPKDQKSNLPVFLIALAAFALFAGILGIWFFLSLGSLNASGSSNASFNNSSRLSNTSSNNASHTPSPTPPPAASTPSGTNIVTRNPSRSTSGGGAQKSSSPKRVSTSGEALKACDYLLGSGIHGKWMQLGGEKGLLGCPIMNETEASRSPRGTTGRMTQFDKGDGGYIIWHGTGRYSGTAFEVSGCMFKLYSSLGNTKSWLGFPIKDGYSTPTGARQDFEGGYILWSSKTYKCQAHKN